MSDKKFNNAATLAALENKIIKLITDTGNEELQNTFLDWQDMRYKMNVSLAANLINEMTTKKQSTMTAPDDYTEAIKLLMIIENDRKKLMEEIKELKELLGRAVCEHLYQDGHIVRYCEWCTKRNKLLDKQ